MSFFRKLCYFSQSSRQLLGVPFLHQSTLKQPVVHKLYMGIINLVPRRALWERVNESLSVTSQLTVEFRIDLSTNGKGIGWGIMYVRQNFTTRSARASFGPEPINARFRSLNTVETATKLAFNFHSQFRNISFFWPFQIHLVY